MSFFFAQIPQLYFFFSSLFWVRVSRVCLGLKKLKSVCLLCFRLKLRLISVWGNGRMHEPLHIVAFMLRIYAVQ